MPGTSRLILLTHGHFDHIGAVNELQARLKVKVCMQKNGRAYVENPVWNLSAYFGLNMVLDDVTYLDDFSGITLRANKNFGVRLIPPAGHTTDGAICKGKIFTLPEETILLSGHSAPTTVGNEKNRPWFSE